MPQPAVVDRVGLGWRGELAAGIFAHLDQIDLVELIADDHFKASAAELRPLKLLAAQVPLSLHGVAMGLAGSEPVADTRLDAMARLAETLAPHSWSEHLAFVRAGGHEVGHLAAPPRTEANIAAAVLHVERAARRVGRLPLMENIASLAEPPGSRCSEPAWITAILEGSGAPMLLDLHNLYANALNFGHDPLELLCAMPLKRVRAVHLSGGRWINEPSLPGVTARPGRRLLDDHLHDVPDPVFALLEELAARVPQGLDVIIERDGEYPGFEVLLAQLAAARAALARGRLRARVDLHAAGGTQWQAAVDGPTARFRWAAAAPTISGSPLAPLEVFLARLYQDAVALEDFLAAPEAALAKAGLDRTDRAAMLNADRTGLVMAARSYARKRGARQPPRNAVSAPPPARPWP